MQLHLYGLLWVWTEQLFRLRLNFVDFILHDPPYACTYLSVAVIHISDLLFALAFFNSFTTWAAGVFHFGLLLRFQRIVLERRVFICVKKCQKWHLSHFFFESRHFPQDDRASLWSMIDLQGKFPKQINIRKRLLLILFLFWKIEKVINCCALVHIIHIEINGLCRTSSYSF